MTGEYCVVLGDVVGSRDIDDRNAFRTALEGAIATVNHEHEDAMHAPFRVLKGVDEFGGVLRSVPPVPDVQRMLSRALHPNEARIAAVVGEVDVNTGADDVAEMDGMAFARADAVLSELESDDFTFQLSGKRETVDALVSDQINLLDVVRSGWSERKMEVVAKYDRLGSQKAVAEALDISVQGVSKHLRPPEVHRVLEIERRLSNALESYPELDTDA